MFTGGRPRAWLQIQGVRCRALIDTGASRTLISEKLFHKLPRLSVLEPAPIILSISNTPVETLGQIHVNVLNEIVPTIVVRNLDIDCILGIYIL